MFSFVCWFYILAKLCLALNTKYTEIVFLVQCVYYSFNRYWSYKSDRAAIEKQKISSIHLNKIPKCWTLFFSYFHDYVI